MTYSETFKFRFEAKKQGRKGKWAFIPVDSEYSANELRYASNKVVKLNCFYPKGIQFQD